MGFLHLPRLPGTFPKIIFAPFFLSKIALDLFEFATAIRPAFCCYQFRRLALCAFIRKYIYFIESSLSHSAVRCV